MAASLHGARVGLLESRLSAELAELVRRMGGTPVLAPSVREVPRSEETARFLERLATGRFSVVVLLTGVGVAALLREADRMQHGASRRAFRTIQHQRRMRPFAHRPRL